MLHVVKLVIKGKMYLLLIQALPCVRLEMSQAGSNHPSGNFSSMLDPLSIYLSRMQPITYVPCPFRRLVIVTLFSRVCLICRSRGLTNLYFLCVYLVFYTVYLCAVARYENKTLHTLFLFCSSSFVRN